VYSTDLKSGQVLVELFLERKGRRCLVIGVQAKLGCHAPPGQFLLGDLVVTTASNDVVKDLEQVEMDRSDLGFGIERCASLEMVFSQPAHEVLVLWRSVDGVEGNLPSCRRHIG
jgi:hypothetical protein